MSEAARHDTRRLASYGALAYALLILYASLHPFTGWRDNGVPLLDFIDAPWPRYWTFFDLGTNVAAYVPLGFLLVPALRPRVPLPIAVGLALIAAVGLSVGLEVLQNFLPSRVPSNVDIACNTAGVLVGALGGVRWGGLFAHGGAVFHWRQARIVPGRVGDLGLVLLALWLATNLNPAMLLFGHGDVRSLLGLASAMEYSAENFVVLEWGIAVAGLIAAGLIARETMHKPSYLLIGLMVVGALLVRGFAAAVILGGEAFLHWATPANKTGFVLGALLLAAALTLPGWARRLVAALALLSATVLANLLPENPYLLSATSQALAGHFLNFNGLTRLISVVWPFLALAWLMTPAQSR